MTEKREYLHVRVHICTIFTMYVTEVIYHEPHTSKTNVSGVFAALIAVWLVSVLVVTF